MKKFTIILSALLFVLCLGFGGRSTYAVQSNESFIKVQTISYQSGAVLQGFYFSCDDEMLALNGADPQTIQAFKNSLLSQINHLKSLMIASYSAIFFFKSSYSALILSCSKPVKRLNCISRIAFA